MITHRARTASGRDCIAAILDAATSIAITDVDLVTGATETRELWRGASVPDRLRAIFLASDAELHEHDGAHVMVTHAGRLAARWEIR